MNVKIGDVINVADIDWIVLDKNDDAILCLMKDLSTTRVIFDEHSENYANSYIKAYIEDIYLHDIITKISKDALYEVNIDLTTDDGQTNNGNCTSKIGLLTTNMYRRYRNIISNHPVVGDWWTATATSSDSTGWSGCVRTVARLGYFTDESVYYNRYVRPFCVFSAKKIFNEE